MSANCLFCKIVAGDIPSKKVYEDELVYAFHDINPQRQVHILVIPKHHLTSLQHASEADEPALGRILAVANKLAVEAGSPGGFRRRALANGVRFDREQPRDLAVAAPALQYELQDRTLVGGKTLQGGHREGSVVEQWPECSGAPRASRTDDKVWRRARGAVGNVAVARDLRLRAHAGLLPGRGLRHRRAAQALGLRFGAAGPRGRADAARRIAAFEAK